MEKRYLKKQSKLLKARIPSAQKNFLLNCLWSDENGFTLSESLFSILILILLSAATAILVITVFRNSNNYIKNIENSKLLLETDSIIRSKISSTIIPYYSNSELIAEQLKSNFYLEGIGDKANITEIKKLYDNNKKLRGLEIRYRFDFSDKEYYTKELFGSEGVIAP